MAGGSLPQLRVIVSQENETLVVLKPAMQMKLVTYRLDNEQDFYRIVSSLKEAEIPFTTRRYADSAFPSFSQTRAFGDISVSPDSEAELRTLIEQLTNTVPLRVGK